MVKQNTLARVSKRKHCALLSLKRWRAFPYTWNIHPALFLLNIISLNNQFIFSLMPENLLQHALGNAHQHIF